ncbi:MAG: hypothetical protein CM1200mP38_2250 [Dehalococcoidia bacterium]|nr:MAG: hypothetical protein CM1200mP38_2250 [Dehalococcoidia bacterium]
MEQNFWGIDNNTGSVESGKFADLIVLNADPLKIFLLDETRNIQVVIIDGNIEKNDNRIGPIKLSIKISNPQHDGFEIVLPYNLSIQHTVNSHGWVI